MSTIEDKVREIVNKRVVGHRIIEHTTIDTRLDALEERIPNATAQAEDVEELDTRIRGLHTRLDAHDPRVSKSQPLDLSTFKPLLTHAHAGAQFLAQVCRSLRCANPTNSLQHLTADLLWSVSNDLQVHQSGGGSRHDPGQHGPRVQDRGRTHQG